MKKENDIENKVKEIFCSRPFEENCTICERENYCNPKLQKLTALIQAEREKVIEEIDKILPTSVSKSLGYTHSELSTMIYEVKEKLSSMRGEKNGK